MTIDTSSQTPVRINLDGGVAGAIDALHTALLLIHWARDHIGHVDPSHLLRGKLGRADEVLADVVMRLEEGRV